MSSRLDALVAREGKDGRSFFTKIGAAFPMKNGGYKIVLDALPVGREILLMEPREQRGSQPSREPGDDGEDRPSW